jgi:LAO/AO transport system kinase
VENREPEAGDLLAGLDQAAINATLILGLTGPPGVGKSTLTGSLIKELRSRNQRIGVIAVDPSSPITGGAILGDRIRMMEHALDGDVVIRSMATRGRLGGLCAAAGAVVRIMAHSGCRIVIIETVGIGQSEMDIVQLADLAVMVLAPGFGDDIQAMKAGILEVCDLLVVNKADQPGAERLLLDMAPLYGRVDEPASRLFPTIASEQQGVQELLDGIFEVERICREDTNFTQRRKRSFELETMDWLVELLRPALAQMVKEQKLEQDPYLAARKLSKEPPLDAIKMDDE